MHLQARTGSVSGSKGESELRRASRRFPLRIAVAMDERSGFTRDVSASGIYFETDAIFLMSKMLDFELLLPRPSGALLRLRCQGEIVRIEPAEDRVGIAVRFTHRPFDDGVLAQVGDAN